MHINGWKYYNHAAIPSTPPHIPVNIRPIKDGSIWEIGEGDAKLVRWHTDWDCGFKTNWWYVIKDTPFDISLLKSKRRYEIRKGNKNFEVREINPAEYGEELYKVAAAAYETYPSSYRPSINREAFINETKKWDFYKTYGAFAIEDNQLCGYACLLRDQEFIDFRNLKAMPEKEKLAVNAAIVNKILIDHEELLSTGGYICDGSRSVQHETAFQDYLEKYFAFRKAYCVLHIEYKASLRIIVYMAYPFRRLLEKLGSLDTIRRINVLLKMEEIRRTIKIEGE